MILYHGVTSYHILSCILHKIKYNSKKECILYISKLNKDSEKLKTKIIESKLFSDVIIFDEFMNFSKFKDNDKLNEIKKEIFIYLKQNNNIPFDQIEEYNICGDHYSLGMYLLHEKINYNYFEEACGILSQSHIVINNLKDLSNLRYNLAITSNVFGIDDIVVKRYGNLSKQLEGYSNPKDVDFVISKILKSLPKSQIKSIINIFQDDFNLELLSSENDLLLTQHFINLNFMTYDEQKNLYTLLVDYFSGSKNLIIKPHPSDIHGLYKEWFPNSILLNRSLPSELLPYCVNDKFEYGITASSTAILNLENIGTSIYFNNDIEKLYLNINRYYFVFKILFAILEKKDKKIYTLGCYNDFLSNFTKRFSAILPEIEILENIEYPDEEDSNRKIFIIDDLKRFDEHPRKKIIDFQKKLNKKDIVIFVNSNNKCYFYNTHQLDLIKNIISILIKKKKIKKYVDYKLMEDEWLYVYCDNKKTRERIVTMNEKILLENTGLELSIQPNNEFELRTLQGILEATEARLLEEIKISKQLRKEKSELLTSNSWKITKPLRKISKYIKKLKKGKNK